MLYSLKLFWNARYKNENNDFRILEKKITRRGLILGVHIHMFVLRQAVWVLLKAAVPTVCTDEYMNMHPPPNLAV